MQNLNKLDLKNKKYIIFDIDGTLIDSIWVWNKIDQELIEEYIGITIDLNTLQIERESFIHSNITGNVYVKYCEYLINKYNFKIKNAKELLKIRWDKSNKYLYEEMDFKKDAPELILKLKNLGFTLILATMSTKVQLDIYSKINKKMIEQMDITKVFDLITKNEDIKNKKPNPEIYNKIMTYYNANPDECLIFEDSYTGVLAGKNAGIEVINIYDKYADLDRDKINEITDYYIDNYRQFINFLEQTYTSTEKPKVYRKYL